MRHFFALVLVGWLTGWQNIVRTRRRLDRPERMNLVIGRASNLARMKPQPSGVEMAARNRKPQGNWERTKSSKANILHTLARQSRESRTNLLVASRLPLIYAALCSPPKCRDSHSAGSDSTAPLRRVIINYQYRPLGAPFVAGREGPNEKKSSRRSKESALCRLSSKQTCVTSPSFRAARKMIDAAETQP